MVEPPRPSILMDDVTVRGELDSMGEVHLHGILEGNIKARKVIIGPGGSIEGEVLADEAEIHGRLKGRAVVRVVVIGETARVEGRIFHHKIDVARGAHIEGRLPWRPVNYFDDADHHFDQVG